MLFILKCAAFEHFPENKPVTQGLQIKQIFLGACTQVQQEPKLKCGYSKQAMMAGKNKYQILTGNNTSKSNKSQNTTIQAATWLVSHKQFR